MLHSSAFDDSHAIPTTADITRFAHRTASLGARVFPSTGLQPYQMLEAIKEAGLAPVVLEGNVKDPAGLPTGFTRERFAADCAALIRSGYPVLLIGRSGSAGHAVCAVGFREAAARTPGPGNIEFQDAGIERVYIHDDNIGPNARFAIKDDPSGHIVLERCPPASSGQLWPDPTYPWPLFTPTLMVAAVHDGLRTSPDALNKAALANAGALLRAVKQQGQQVGLTISTRLIRLPDYHKELGRRLTGAPRALARASLGLLEDAPPMSLHVGVVRIGVGQTPVFDILFDTTDSDRNLPAFCHLSFDPAASSYSQAMHAASWVNWGTEVRAF